MTYFVFRTYPLRRLEKTLTDLQRERDKSDKTLYAIGDGVITADHRGKILLINRVAEALVGMDTSEAVGRQLEEVYVLRLSQENQIGETGEKVAILTGKGGNEYAIEEVRTHLTEMEGDESGVVIIFRDITDRKQAEIERQQFEQQLQHAQKLESLGVLAGGIAHDFNNILTVIMCYCSLGEQQPEKAGEFFPGIEKSVDRAAELCRLMLAYAGKTQFVQSHIDMTALVDDMLSMLKSTLPQNVTIKPCLTGDLPSIEGDAGQLRQIVMNMIINASEAIGEVQGEIVVSLTRKAVTAGQSEKDHLGKAITPGKYLCLEVADSGCGMDDETKQRIFEPFYTTKFVGRGLGMSAVLGIITSHKGALQFTSQPSRGTTFKVYLPVKNAEGAVVGSIQQTTRVPWQGSGTILLVDDEEQILQVAKALLESLKFSVIEASNGIEAIEQYRKNAAEITMVVTDIGMPLMDGYELIAELKQLDPSLPVIVSSGFGDADVTSKIASGDIAGLISKPYHFDQFREVLKGVVEGGLKKSENRSVGGRLPSFEDTE
jgi:PAS domain S-box-containing protein